MRRIVATVTTAAGGAATVFTPRLSGKVHSVHYLKAAADSFADGVDFIITAEKTGETVWAENNVNAAAVRYPRAATHSTSGVAALYAAGGTAVQAPVALANDRLKIVIAQGGATKTGEFVFLID